MSTDVNHRLSDSTPAHKALKLVVNARSRNTPHHGWNRPAGRPRTSWISQIGRDTALTTHGLLPQHMQPVTRQIRAALSE